MGTSRDFEARRGRSISYEVYRPSKRHARLPVLFIHGWRSSPAMFHDLLACLDIDDFECIVPRFSGDDGSHRATPGSPIAGAIDLIDELHVERLGIVAFGMFGGSVARRLIQVLGYNRVSFASLLSPGPCLIDSPARDAFWNMLPVETRSKILDMKPEDLDAMVVKTVELFSEHFPAPSRVALSADLHSMVEEILALSGSATKHHGACPVPVQLICGELDEIVPLELSFKTVKDFGEVHVNVIPLAGHHFVTEFPEETARCMIEFLVDKVTGVCGGKAALAVDADLGFP